MSMRLLGAVSTTYKRSLVIRLWLYVVLIGTYSGLAAYKEISPWKEIGNIPANGHAVLGVALSILLVFRTNTAYDRWWEGRKLWGQLVNDSRNLAVKIRCFVDADNEEKRRVGDLIISFSFLLKEHLRGVIEVVTEQKLASKAMDLEMAKKSFVAIEQVPGLGKSYEPKHLPLFIIAQIYDRLAQWKKNGQVTGFDALMLDESAHQLSNILGACERIRKTPLSRSYTSYIMQCNWLYLATLPWGLAQDFNLFTIPATMIVAYFMLGIEMIGHSIENPFGRDLDDLPLGDICRGIEASVREVLHEYPDPHEMKGPSDFEPMRRR